ncbi:NUDIX hydrolase [bacterium]|nr:NUDIX hydrolase [bacterium]
MFELDYQDMKGQHKTWQFASRHQEPRCISRSFDAPDAVVIVPFHKEKNKLVVIKEFRVPLADYQLGFPAGLIDTGETIEEAGKRELNEETGLILTRVLKKSPPVYSTSGLTDESVSLLYVECEGEVSNEHNESSEDISVQFLSPEECFSIINHTDLKIDVKTWLVLSSYAENGRL